ncbi:MAG: hypothetical protein RIS90_2748 [Pseudomonadota bacterium]
MLLAWLLTGSPGAVRAQPAGEVEFVRGVAFAQTGVQLPRAMGKGLALKEGDRLTTGEGATAILKLADGTRMTLRPNSEMVVQVYKYAENASGDDNSMVLQLLRGGFRTITGLIAKGSPDAAKVQTSTATIGIRGTDFDARLCGQDCKAESSKIQGAASPNAILASAKLVVAQGDIFAVAEGGARRRLVVGGSVYVGDRIETGAGARAVLVFRDDSRLTVGPSSKFLMENFVYDEKNPEDGRFLVSLLTGTMRALTGFVGKANPKNVGFTTSTATIGIRGTGLDLDCGSTGSCSFFTWLGSITVTPSGQTALQVLQSGQGLFVSAAGIRPITAPTLESLPRPDTVPANTKELFGAAKATPAPTAAGDKAADKAADTPADNKTDNKANNRSDTPTRSDTPAVASAAATPTAQPAPAAAPPSLADEPGLFVTVRDGHVEVTSRNETIHLGRGETGFAAADGRTGRPATIPLFIQYDKVPLPTNTNAAVQSIIKQLSEKPSNQCR